MALSNLDDSLGENQLFNQALIKSGDIQLAEELILDSFSSNLILPTATEYIQLLLYLANNTERFADLWELLTELILMCCTLD